MGRILFADDDPAMRDMVADALASAGHTVRVVPNGSDALVELRANPPDLALLDYRMGVPDGLEVCRRIKSEPQFEHLPVVILTADGDVEDRIRGFEAGANDYLAKPFDSRELIARVRALLVLSEQTRRLNPTTGLPGGVMIEREFEHRRESGAPFALCYLDLEHFKSFNDRFGFATANAVIEFVGVELRNAVAGTPHFAGHIGGDDFVLMCDQPVARPLADLIQARLRQALIRYVPAEIVERGVYKGRLRGGSEETVPLTRVTAVVLYLEPSTMPSLTVLAEMAAEGKAHAKVAAEAGVVEVEIVAG
jgi:PleD family two-component response regulator